MVPEPTYDSETGITQVVLSGEITGPLLREIIKQTFAFMKTHNSWQLLTDAQQVTQWNFSTIEVYEIPQFIIQTLNTYGLPHYQVRRALVVSAPTAEIDFYELVAGNRGHYQKLFLDIAEARAWLLQVPPLPTEPTQ